MQQFNPSGYINGVTAPPAADFQAIAADLAKRGITIDGGGYGRVNTGFILLLAGDLPGTTYTVTAASWAANVATLTIGAHNIRVNQRVSVSGATPTGYNSGTDSVPITAVTSTTISFALTTNPGAWSSGGTVLVGATAQANGIVGLNPLGALAVCVNGAFTGEWNTPTLQNGWVAYGSGFATPRYAIDPAGVVHLSGIMKSGTATDGTWLFTLLPGFRPLTNVQPVSWGGATLYNPISIYINASTGAVYVFGLGGSNAALSLDGVSFPTF